MICLDTTFLIDLWRNREDPGHPTVRLLRECAGEVFAVPVTAAGEFLEGAAVVSEERLRDSLAFLRMFELGDVTLDTAVRYAEAVAHLRRAELLTGSSKHDLWIAAWAMAHQARLATRNVRHFQHVPGLNLVSY